MELGQYIRPLLRWWWLIALSTVIAGGASYVATKQQPTIYQTSATMLVGQVTRQREVSTTDFYLTQELAASYAQIAVRQPILSATVDSLGLDIDWQSLKEQVHVQSIPQTQLLQIVVNDTVPERAIAIADGIANQLILQSPESVQNKERQERSDFVKSQLDDLEIRIENAKSRVAELQVELDTALSARQIQDLQTEISNLESFVDGWQANYTELLNFLDGGDSPNNLTIIEPAQWPYKVGPQLTLNLLLAAVAGFVLAAGAAIVLEYLDDTIKSLSDLDPSLGLAGLGTIGKITGDEASDKLVASKDLFSPLSEAYRLVRSNIQFMGVDNPVKSLVVTSSNPGEGKSTTAANLAVTMAQAELKTVIIDADLRRPTLHKLFNMPNLGGLTDLLRSDEMDIEPYLKETEIENLLVVTTGPLPPNPAELLGSQRMSYLLKNLKEVVDMIIIDSPPTLAVSDSMALASKVDGLVLVVRASQTRRGMISETVKRLNQVKVNILGVVLNGAAEGSGGYYYHYYSHDTKSSGRQKGRFKFWQRFPRLPLPRFKKSNYASPIDTGEM